MAMEEMTNIQKLARQALKTFRTASETPSKQNLELLKSMMEKITAADVNLHDPRRDRRRSLPDASPVTHINILECPYFSMAIFIVNRGRNLPLHDHPRMYGLCKVLYNSIQVKIYDRLESEGHENSNGTLSDSSKEPQKFISHGEPIFDVKDGVCMVTPSYGNYHTIKAINGTAAFLDILGPPYSCEKGRDCSYYKECQSKRVPSENGESDVRYLIEVPCPQEFFCDSQVYKGPKIDLAELIKSCDED